jgi:hypothetical protein
MAVVREATYGSPMALGLEFNDTFDITAIGTVALAIVTFVSLLFGWRTLRQTKASIELSRREVEEAQRPVLVPLRDPGRTLTIMGGQELPAMPCVPRTGLLVVPVRNVGKGPALRVDVTVEGFNAAGGWSAAWSGPQSVGLLATAIGSEEMTPLEVELHGVADVPGFSLSLVYEDVAGKGWWTFTRWLPDLGRYENVSIEEQPTKNVEPCPRPNSRLS